MIDDDPRRGLSPVERALEASKAQPAPEPMLRWFAYAHLPEKLQAVSRIFHDAAQAIVAQVPPSAERTVALRKLLEGKDAAVRASLG